MWIPLTSIAAVHTIVSKRISQEKYAGIMELNPIEGIVTLSNRI